MVLAGIVAGGTGSRMGANIPKQFIEINGIPIIIYTMRAFLAVNEIENIFTAVHPDWLEHTHELVKSHLSEEERKRIVLINAGIDRTDSVLKLVAAVSATYDLSDDDIILTHDAVRPFVTEEIIRENIASARDNTVCTTAVSATDTILYSEEGSTVSNTPDRSKLYNAQTPQSFKINTFRICFNELSEEQRSTLTDVCGVFTDVGLNVHIVKGAPENIKITTPFDLAIAKAVLSK